MPRSAAGVYSLPVASYVANTTIRSTDMNSNLSDIGSTLTTSLATTGVSTMTGPIRLADGSAAAPSLTLASDVATGWYRSAGGAWTFVSSGNAIITLGPTSISAGTLTVANLTVTGTFSVAANRIVGEVVDYCGVAAPSLWLLAFGQAISRSTFSSLFAIIGTTYGVGDGSTTFNVPDYRGRLGAGKDDMGGSAANRLTNQPGGINGLILGAVGGLQTHVITTAQLASHLHSGTADANGSHSHSYTTSSFNVDVANKVGGAVMGVAQSLATSTDGTHTHTFTSGATGSDNAHNNVQPCIIVNKIIYAAV